MGFNESVRANNNDKLDQEIVLISASKNGNLLSTQ